MEKAISLPAQRPTKLKRIIITYVILFNIGLQPNDDAPSEDEGIEEEPNVSEEMSLIEDADVVGTVDGFAAREEIVANYH